MDLTTVFTNTNLEAADQFLRDFACRLQAEIDNSELIDDQYVVFSAAALDQVTVADVRKLAGYADLKKACEARNLCLGYPVVNRKPEDRFGSIRIYPKLPYAASEDVFLDQGKTRHYVAPVCKRTLRHPLRGQLV